MGIFIWRLAQTEETLLTYVMSVLSESEVTYMFGCYGYGGGGSSCGGGYGYGGGGSYGGGYGSTFVLIVVLFILLIIVGASFC